MTPLQKWATRILLPDVGDGSSDNESNKVVEFIIYFAENGFPILPDVDADGYRIVQVGTRQGYLHAYVTASYGKCSSALDRSRITLILMF